MNQLLDRQKAMEEPLNIALNYLSYQPRTVFEIKKHLEKKGFDHEIKHEVIEFLLERKYLNDRDFVELFVRSKVKYKARSKFAFKYQLKQKGVNSQTIDDVLEEYDDHELALKSVESKIKLWKTFEYEKFKKKAMNYLRYRGFSYEICVSTLNHYAELFDIR
jgi:regulatory protein